MKIIRSVRDFQALELKGSIGFAPTMGALHRGHASLFERARSENEIAVASIFINPTQFNDANDFQKYPKTWDADLATLEKAGIDFLFAPTFAEMYPDQYRYGVTEKELSQKLCGAHRPGHFDGVLTVVMKLFQIVRPTRAYFGEKDFQQLQLIYGMTQAFFLPITLVPCATIREPDGLALSSRNARLTPEGRARAPQIWRALKESSSAKQARTQLEASGIKIDYVEDEGRRRYAAVFIDDVRLIDNVEI